MKESVFSLFKKRKSLQKKIFTYFLIFTLTFTFTAFFLIENVFFKNYVNSLRDHAVNSTNEAKQSIEFLLNMTSNTASLLATNQALLDGLRTIESPEEEHYFFQKNEIDNMLKSIISVHEYIDNIYILGSDGEFFSGYWNTDQNAVEARFGEFIRKQKKREEYINGEPIINYLPFFDLNVISFIRPVFQYPEDLGLGMIVIDLNYTYLRELFSFSSLQQDEEKTLVINKEGDTIFTFPFNTSLEHIVGEYPDLLEHDSSIDGKVFGKESIMLSNRIAHSDWTMIRIISKDRIYTAVRQLTQLAIALWIVFIVISFLISYYLSVSITTPIVELNDTIKKVQTGNLNVQARIAGEDEIGELASSFNHMVHRLSELMEKTLDEQKKKSDLEFQILQSQINPHFLYNTLDSIKWLAVFQNVENISDMVTALINLLKYNISKKSKLVSLEEEINSIKDYIEIQKFRFGDDFDVLYEIEEDTRDCHILKFILQPLVENSIFHGFENIDYQGVIRIHTALKGQKLVIRVIDNGKGLVKNQDYLKQRSSYDHKKMHNSIGVRNVMDRIKLYFGEKADFSLENGLERGVVVTLSLPLLHSASRFPEENESIRGYIE